MDAPVLSTTSYALLTLLSLRSWTTYELTKQMRRNYHWFWPRAESKLYQEPKKLVTLGLARSDPGPGGRGKGTVYHITPAGRQALADWVRSPRPSLPRLEFEALVRVFAADHGTPRSLLQTVRGVKEEVEVMQRFGANLGTETATTGGGPFPDRVHINALVHRFLWEFSEAVRRWALWAEAEVETWADMSVADKEGQALRHFLLPSEILTQRGTESGEDRCTDYDEATRC